MGDWIGKDNDAYVAIMSEDPGRDHKPVDVEEMDVSGEMSDRVAALERSEALLYGDKGQPGMLEEFRNDLKMLINDNKVFEQRMIQGQEEIKEKLSGMENRISNNETDINGLGNKVDASITRMNKKVDEAIGRVKGKDVAAEFRVAAINGGVYGFLIALWYGLKALVAGGG